LICIATFSNSRQVLSSFISSTVFFVFCIIFSLCKHICSLQIKLFLSSQNKTIQIKKTTKKPKCIQTMVAHFIIFWCHHCVSYFDFKLANRNLKINIKGKSSIIFFLNHDAVFPLHPWNGKEAGISFCFQMALSIRKLFLYLEISNVGHRILNSQSAKLSWQEKYKLNSIG
jgi:hypothetical protein